MAVAAAVGALWQGLGVALDFADVGLAFVGVGGDGEHDGVGCDAIENGGDGLGFGAVRAAPVFRSARGARVAAIPATRWSGKEARGPCRSVTRSRNRAVLVTFLGCGAVAGRRPGATGQPARTQARNPARVEAGVRARRSSHSSRPPGLPAGWPRRR